MTNRVISTRLAVACAAALATAGFGLEFAGLTPQPAIAQAEKSKELSEKTVQYIMDLAWQVLPAKFTSPDGKKIEVDKTKRAPVMVPIDIAREIIVVGNNSGIAQLCQMWEEQHANYHTLMRRELVRKGDDGKQRWTDQQMLYINTLHRMALHLAAGKLRVEDKGGEKHVHLEPIDVAAGNACNDERRTRTKSAILEFLKRNGVASTGGVAPVPGMGPAAQQPAAQPASDKK